MVAFGQPAWLVGLAPVCAVAGYALFWHAGSQWTSRKMQFWSATTFFCAVQLVQLSWMFSYEFQGTYIFLVAFLLSFGLGVQFGLLSLCVWRGKDLLLLVPALWTLMEWSRTYFLCGFSWNPVGLALTASIYPLQFASVFGIFGLSFWVILTNVTALTCFKQNATKARWMTFGLIALIPYLFGFFHLAYHQKEKRSYPDQIVAALVQPALLPSQKGLLEGRELEFVAPLEQWRNILSMLASSSQKVELIALPESAVPFFADEKVYPYPLAAALIRQELGETELPPCDNERENVSNSFFAQAIANHFHAEVVAGFDGKEGETLTNAAFHYLPLSSDKVDRYDKRVLVPMAEYLPFSWAKSLAKRYGIEFFFTPGQEARPLTKGKRALSLSICYEETFPYIMRDGRLEGADLFLNLTNDNWYPYSRLPKQHFDLARVRTVENGVPLLRACNSGVTSAVDSLGQIASILTADGKLDAPGLLIASVSGYHYKTLYLIWGNQAILFLSCGLLLLTSYLFLKRRTRLAKMDEI